MTALLGLLGPFIKPLADLFGQLFQAWLAYRAGANQQRAEQAERAMEIGRELRTIENDRAGVSADDRRERVREHFAKRP